MRVTLYAFAAVLALTASSLCHAETKGPAPKKTPATGASQTGPLGTGPMVIGPAMHHGSTILTPLGGAANKGVANGGALAVRKTGEIGGPGVRPKPH
jgi:hypothetical protein